MLTALAAVAALCLSVFLLFAGNGLMFALLPLRAELEAFDPFAIGMMGSAYFLGMMMGCFLSPILIRWAGHVRAFAACTALTTIAPLLHALAPDPVIWIAVRMVAGVCAACLFAIIESWMNEKASNEYRGQVLAIYNVITYAGLSFGQQFLRLYEPSGFQLFLLAAILVSLAAVPISLSRSSAAYVPESPRLRIMWLFRLSPVGVIACAGVGMANGSFFSFAPIFGSEIGLSSAQVGTFFSLSLVGSVLTLWPLGRLSDLMDRRIVLIGCCLAAAAAGAALFAFATRTEGAILPIYAFGFLFGAFAMPIYAIGSAHANDFAEPEELVEVSTGLLLTYTFGAMAGPAILSVLLEWTSILTLFGFIGIVHLTMAGLTFLRIAMRSAVPVDERQDFVAVPASSPAAIELSPYAAASHDSDLDVPFPAEADHPEPEWGEVEDSVDDAGTPVATVPETQTP